MCKSITYSNAKKYEKLKKNNQIIQLKWNRTIKTSNYTIFKYRNVDPLCTEKKIAQNVKKHPQPALFLISY